MAEPVAPFPKYFQNFIPHPQPQALIQVYPLSSPTCTMAAASSLFSQLLPSPYSLFPMQPEVPPQLRGMGLLHPIPGTGQCSQPQPPKPCELCHHLSTITSAHSLPCSPHSKHTGVLAPPHPTFALTFPSVWNAPPPYTRFLLSPFKILLIGAFSVRPLL